MPITAAMSGLAMMLAATTQAAPATPAAPHPTDSSTAVTLVPMETRMGVEVVINGAGPFRFIVDSGASHTVISARLAALLHLPAAGTVTLQSVGATTRVPSVAIAALTIGDLPTQPVTAPVLDEANLGAAGIIGIDVLADKRVLIDLPANRMTVVRSAEKRIPARPGEIVVVARRRFGQLVLVNADVDGQHIDAIVDTGTPVTIGNGTLARRLLRHGLPLLGPASVQDVSGLRIPVGMASTHGIRIGGVTVRNIDTAFCDAQVFDRFGLRRKPAMLLGMDLLRAFRRVSIDFPRKTVRLLTTAGDAGAGPR